MKLLDESLAPLFTYECDCGEVFDCDAGTEENTWWNPLGRFNCPMCPKCGRVGSEAQVEVGEHVVITGSMYGEFPATVVRIGKSHFGIPDDDDLNAAEEVPAVWVKTRDRPEDPFPLTWIRRPDVIEKLATLDGSSS